MQYSTPFSQRLRLGLHVHDNVLRLAQSFRVVRKARHAIGECYFRFQMSLPPADSTVAHLLPSPTHLGGDAPPPAPGQRGLRAPAVYVRLRAQRPVHGRHGARPRPDDVLLELRRCPRPAVRLHRSRAAVDTLSATGLVFGGLRLQNVMCIPSEAAPESSEGLGDERPGGLAKLVDFDWASTAGVNRYPATLDDSLPDWTVGIERYGMMRTEHDRGMLRKLEKYCEGPGRSEDRCVSVRYASMCLFLTVFLLVAMRASAGRIFQGHNVGSLICGTQTDEHERGRMARICRRISMFPYVVACLFGPLACQIFFI